MIEFYLIESQQSPKFRLEIYYVKGPIHRIVGNNAVIS